jgi:hypothetical protein
VSWIRHQALLGACVVVAAACTAVVPVRNKDFITTKRPREVWVTRADGLVVHVFDPRFLGDTLVGIVDGKLRRVGIFRTGDVAPGSGPDSAHVTPRHAEAR